MHNIAATFDTQLSPVAPFLFYLVIGLIIFIETGLLIGFFLPGDSLLFSAGLVAAARDDINIVIFISVVFLAAFIGDQVGYVIGRKVGRPYLQRRNTPRMMRMMISDITYALDYEVAAELVEVLDLEYPEEEDESQPGGDIDLLSDLGVGEMELLAILDDTELYPDEQLEAIANRLGFGEQFNQVIESN